MLYKNTKGEKTFNREKNLFSNSKDGLTKCEKLHKTIVLSLNKYLF